jgi:uncharacterized protein (DUF2252 family)
VRLLGDRDEVDQRTAKLNQTVVDRTAQVQADAEAIRQLAARVRVLTFVNNHFAGYAPATVAELQRLLGQV